MRIKLRIKRVSGGKKYLFFGKFPNVLNELSFLNHSIIYDEAFCKNKKQLKAVNFFKRNLRDKCLKNPKYVPDRIILMRKVTISLLTFAYSKSTIETLKKSVKYVQS